MASEQRISVQRYNLQLPPTILLPLYPHDFVEVRQEPDGANTIFIRKNRILLIYESYNSNTTTATTTTTTSIGSWSEAHEVPDFFTLPDKHPNYPWEVYEDGLLVVRKMVGLELYKWANRQLTRVSSYSNFNDAYGYGSTKNMFLVGKMFPTQNHLGIASRIGSTVRFHSIDLANGEYKLRSLSQKSTLTAAWSANQSQPIMLLVGNLQQTHQPQLSIALRTVSELKLFRFDDAYAPHALTTVQDFPPVDVEYDRILFARFNSTRYNDLLHFSTEGLSLYRYDETEAGYKKIYYSTAFSKLRGWNGRMIDTLATLDIDGTDTQRIVCSGPTGLSVIQPGASDLGFTLTNVLDGTGDSQAVRYALPKHAQRRSGPGGNEGDLEIFLHTPSGLECVQVNRYLAEAEQLPDKPETGEETDSQMSKIIPEIVAHGKKTLWLHDQLDLASLLQPLNPHTGAVEMTLPLIDLRAPFGVPIRKPFQYKNIDYNNELGRGWSFPLDYITLERYDSAFEQDHVYSLIKDNQQIILNRVFEKQQQPTQPPPQPKNDTSSPTSSTREGIRFTIDGYPDIEILFETKHNQWWVEIDKRTLLYTTVSGFMVNNVCPMWPLCGDKSKKNVLQTTRWYLKQEVDDGAGWDAKYVYELVKNATDIRLQSIERHDNASVKLGYEQDRISSLTVSTMNYRQDVRFHYHHPSSGSDPLLVSISQDGRPLFEFDYDAQHRRLSKIVHPNGVVWTPVYQELSIDPSSLKQQINVLYDGTIFYGPDYLVIVDANLSDGLITLNMRDPLGGPGAGGKTNATVTVHALDDIKRYIVHALADLLVVSIIYGTDKDIAVLQYTEGSTGWVQREYYHKLPLDTTVTAGNTFALLADTKTLRLLTITEGRLTVTVVREELPKNFVVHAFPHGYATYDGKMDIFILHPNGSWITVATKDEPNRFNDLNRFLDSFAIDAELRVSIRRGLMADMVGSFRQTVILKWPMLRGTALDISVRFYMLNLSESPKIADYYTVYVPYAKMNTFTYTLTTKDKDKFLLGYRAENNKFRLYVKESSGPHKVAFDEHLAKVKSQTSKASDLEAAQKAINDEYARIYRSVTDAVIFAIDLSLFGLLTNREGVLTGSHLITCHGGVWDKKLLDEDNIRMRKVDQSINERYRLVKANASETFKIVSKPDGTTVFDALTSKGEELHLVAPYYAQAQPRGHPVRVYFFGTGSGDRNVISELPAEEHLNSASNQMAIVTNIRGANQTTPHAILFRCVKYFLDQTISVLGGQTLRSGGERTIVTSYQYDTNDLQLSVDGIMFRRIRIVPGGNVTRFGWYEQSVDLQTGKTTRQAFAANGRPVVDPKLREQEKKHRESEQAPEMRASDFDKMILDIGGRMQIVDLGPYRLDDEMVSYYGFETYEANRFGKENRWVFDEKQIHSDGNNRFLRLSQPVHTLTGQFMPLEPYQRFVVSCWMRTEASTAVGDTLDTLAVDVLIDKAEGKKISTKSTTVKQQIGDWSYVETTLDATTTDIPPPGSKLMFVIIVAPSAGHPVIDIDHIRFSPLGMQFEANIYEPISGQLRAVLGGNGLPKSYLYNSRGKKSAVFSEHGEVLQFAMQSKVMHLSRAVAGAKPCVIEIKPRASVYNRFDQTASSRWRTRNSDGWLMQKGSATFQGINGSEASIEKAFPGQWTSLALRFLYNLTPGEAGRMKLVWQTEEFHLPCAATSQNECHLSMPTDGEVLVFITEQHISIWVDGILLHEASLTAAAAQERVFRVQAVGYIEISEFIEMYDARIKVTYQNLSGQPTQLLVYEDPQTVRLREIRYDTIERPILQTKWTKVHRNESEAFFAFYDNFITAFDNKTLQLHGFVADRHPACEGYPYTYTVYGSDPTENKRLQGLPGKPYGVQGKYRRQYASAPDNVMLNNLFPSADGFNQMATIHPGGAVHVTVEDGQGNKVAKYSKVGNYADRLSTFRYGRVSNKIEQELPPLFHSIAGTASMNDFFGDNHDAKRKELENQWEVRFDYDNEKRVTRKRTPDGGAYQYLYDRYGILRFSLHKDANGTLDRVLHFMYAADGKITHEALVNLTETECNALLDGSKIPESTNFIDTLYGAQDANPNFRHRTKFSSRRIDDDQMTEFLLYDEREQLLTKTFVVNTINTSYSINYEYENDKLRSIKYPIGGAGDKPYKFIYDYNGHGEVATIRESTQRDPMFEYTYNADGMVETMNVRAGTANRFFQRKFSYNEPGFLVKLSDDFLTEEVSYLETDSYGQDSYTPIYEGLISRTVFTAHWPRAANALRVGLHPEDLVLVRGHINRQQARICFNALKAKGYLNERNQVNRTFYGGLEDDLPFACGDIIPMNHLSAVLSSGSFPHQYGHRYDYDDHDQLIKAKYFHGADELRKLKPLTHLTFAGAISGVKENESKQIWDALLAGRFLSADCTNPNLCHGREGTRSMFNEFVRKHPYRKHLQVMFANAIAKRNGLNEDAFNARCKKWIVGSNLPKLLCSNIKRSLVNRKLVGNSPTANPLASLSDEFKGALQKFGSRIPDIVRVLSEHFATALGRSAGDVQSYEIDANGNHRKFYTGFSRYRLEYREGTNQITKLHRQHFDRDQRVEEHFQMEHNSDGAVVKAEHKGINRMEYDGILHRVMKIEMQDGRKLLFQYDVRAERTFKQVLNADGTVSHEKYYIRDAHGLVLVDMEMTYLAKDQPPDVRVTSYIYKDQQLVGFVRNDKLYGVISDHEGSVRLVVRDGEVVAAYDYLPYGQIFRRYGTDLDGQIAYLYTGQEWEPETGLYNYRARLYDPDIGRFYQMDPKEQYPSPYVYAGNSPVSLVDPDGEFAFALACLILSLLGAYLGAASAAKSWNPLQWNWKSKSLWLGLFGGALTGLSIPFNMTASVAYFVGLGLSLTASIGIMVCSGITFGYFALAAASGTWDPTKFDFTSPGTWNALLGGISTSAFIVTNPNTLMTTYRSITSILGRALFVTATVGLSVTFAYLFAVVKMGGEFNVAKWDFTDPGLYYSIVDGVTTISFAVTIARNIPRTVRNWGKKIEASLDRLAEVEVFFRARNLMRGDWSMKLSNIPYFIAANAQGIARLQRGILPIGFYTFILSLRMADCYEKSPVPGFSVFMSIISTVITTRGFSNRVVKQLVPRVSNGPLAMHLVAASGHSADLDGISSGADSLGGFFKTLFQTQYARWVRSTTETPDRKASTNDSPGKENDLAHHQRNVDQRSQTSKSASIANCYRVVDAESNGYYVKCYAVDSITTIFPKPEAILDPSHDTYRHCLPLTLDGVPGISCDGERSSLLSTVVEAPKLFDYVDGWLLLARIAPAAVREARRILGGIFRRRPSSVPVVPQAVRQRHAEGMMATLRRVHSLSKELPPESERNWIAPTLADVREDVAEYLTHGRGNCAILLERLDALESDIQEEIDVRHAKQFVQHQVHQARIAGIVDRAAAASASYDDRFMTNMGSVCYDFKTALLSLE